MDRSLLVENGGHVQLSKDCAKALMKRMGLVKRKGTTSKSKDTKEDLERLFRTGENNRCDGRDTTRTDSELGPDWT